MNEKSELRKKTEALANQLRMQENQHKPRNSTNNVSFAELMRQLRGEG